MVLQISRFDHFKDPGGMVQAYLRENFLITQQLRSNLALIMPLMHDDTERLEIT